MSLQKYTPTHPIKHRKNLWFERLMAIAAATNLAFVVFDLTYVSWRNFWLQGNIAIPFTQQKIHVPFPTMTQSAITCLYDPVKGIEPNRDTDDYLKVVDLLERQVAEKGLETGLQSREVQKTLTRLRRLSSNMLTSNPFEAADKSGTLEKIKNEMVEQVSQRVKSDISSQDAFDIFWSTNNSTYPNYLSAPTWKAEITWFNKTIRPLIATNFYRTISENGDPTNYFWVIDAPFAILFLLEFLARTFYTSRRYSSLTWLDAMVWRWYDILLFVPFSVFAPWLALLRVIPTTLRSHQAELIDLHTINARIRQGFVAAIADEITEIVIVQVINQVQILVRRGELTELLQRASSRHYVDLNNINEVEAISKQLVQLFVYQIFPKVQPDVEQLLSHSISTVLSQSPAYRGLTALPGIGTVPGQITDRLVADITQTLYQSVTSILEDAKTVELITQLVQNFSDTFVSEAQQNRNLEEIQLLLADLLEEIKINYVQRISQEDARLILDEARQLKQRTQDATP